MRRAFFVLLLLVLPGSRSAATDLYVGRFREPVPDPRQWMPFKLQAASEELLKTLPSPPSPGDRVFAAALRPLRQSEREAQVVLVEPARGAPFLHADLNLDGRLDAGERFELGPGPAVLRFPSSGGLPFFPVALDRDPSRAEADDEVRTLRRSRGGYVEGTVYVDTRELLVRYPLSEETGGPELRGEIWMDLDGDGAVDPGLSAGEVEMAGGERPVIFRLGDRYLSTRLLEPAKGRFILRTHPASEYDRLELRPGSEVPDIVFTDLEGRERRLSELRGKVVLLDFWGTWCKACVDELPTLRSVHQAYRERGFEILGLAFDDDLATQKRRVAEWNMPWVHATAESVKDVITRRFRVWEFPTKILLDREGRIVSLGETGQPPLDEKNLGKTIDAATQDAAVSRR